MSPSRPSTASSDNPRIARALLLARDTRHFVAGANVLDCAPSLFERIAGDRPALVVADPNTYRAAGQAVAKTLADSDVALYPPHILSSRKPRADGETLAEVRDALRKTDAVAVAVGSGTINDLCKRASFELRRPYLVVATAASVDGYASFGAPITIDGFKITRPCSAPAAILADTGILRAAPYAMTAAGYADLTAKNIAGCDWILADVVGVDPVRKKAWDIVQPHLDDWLADPERLAAGDANRLAALFEGLTLSGLAMQATESSRPASGSEHLFAHVWDMARHKGPDGEVPSHGFLVALGTMAASAVYDALFARDFTKADRDRAVARHPAWKDREAAIRELFGDGPLAGSVLAESKAKHLTRDALAARLDLVRDRWTEMREKVLARRIPIDELRRRFAAAKCPAGPQDLGLAPARIAATVFAAQMIRARYTVLDLAAETGRLPEVAQRLMTVWAE